MPRSALQHVEVFHLLLLRMFEARLNRSTYVVKGGVNLRAWFGSLRYSEDIDIDAIAGQPHELRTKVDGLLTSKPFQGLLLTQRLTLGRISKPKQTETTQRWKFELQAEGLALPLNTKVEFSRRGGDDEYILESVRADVARPYGISNPTANHYTARSAAAQKIRALARRSQTQARDIWDLEHLFRTTDCDLRPLTKGLAPFISAAIERLMDMSFDVFKAQVLPFLAADQRELYREPQTWENILDLVMDRLLELRS